MYSNKQNIQQLLSLMLEHGVRHVVLSPGSRNAPLIHSLNQHPSFTCYTIVDERSASYFALGLILKLQQPVAICCTSGTALLNYSSATAEAFYQRLPLLVISADRPIHWIGQADGQTINQKNVLANFVRKSITLPEIFSNDDKWLCNRLINEGLLALTVGDVGPVHINIPLSEPLYEFTAEYLPVARKIEKAKGRKELPTSYLEMWKGYKKRMVVVGQHLPNEQFSAIIENFALRGDTVIIAEHTANLSASSSVAYFEQILTSFKEDEEASFAPDLLLTLGGHIISKKLKQFLRKNRPLAHWHVGAEVVDTFQSLTDLIDVDASSLVEALASVELGDLSYSNAWNIRCNAIATMAKEYLARASYSDLSVFNAIFKWMPSNISLHLGNSTPVRYAQQFMLPANVRVFSNRGTSGIDGVVSTFAGYSVNATELSVLLIGELSFFYDSNGLWNRYLSTNCRIVVINNAGGGIFRLIDGPSRSNALEEHIEYSHNQSVENIAKAFGVRYLSASSQKEVDKQIATLFDCSFQEPMLLEVFTPSKVNAAIYKGFFDHIKTK